MKPMQNLLSQPEPTRLPDQPAAREALAAAPEDDLSALKSVAAAHPSYSAAWGRLAERALAASDPVQAYAYARTGYHRGLDQLRRNGWRGSGPVPWAHEPNRGFLRCLYALGVAAGAIGETDEADRCEQFLRDCDPAAAEALSA
jgi:Protein of unknown function (DUF3151)